MLNATQKASAPSRQTGILRGLNEASIGQRQLRENPWVSSLRRVRGSRNDGIWVLTKLLSSKAQLKTAWKTFQRMLSRRARGKIWGSDFNLARVNETPDEIMERLETAQKDSCEDEITNRAASHSVVLRFQGKAFMMRNQASIEHSTV